MVTERNRWLAATTVNLLTFSRLVAGILSVVVFAIERNPISLGTVFLFILVSDLLDGALARRWAVTIKIGAVFDYVVDRFNIYVQIATLLSEGLHIWVFIPFFLRDLLYVLTQSYLSKDRISGTKSLSFLSTFATYIFVLYLTVNPTIDTIMQAVLFFSYLISLGNFGHRIYRLRDQLREEFGKDFFVK